MIITFAILKNKSKLIISQKLMVKVKGFWSDTFEQLTEFGQSTVKKSGQAINQTFSPLKILETTDNSPLTENSSKKDRGERLPSKKQNSTPLDLESLHKNYQNQDKQKANALRFRLFQMVRSQEEKVIAQKKQEELERKRKLTYEEEQKKRKEKEKKKREQTLVVPKGKIRRSIFSPKKMAERQQAEVKPASGKQ